MHSRTGFTIFLLMTWAWALSGLGYAQTVRHVATTGSDAGDCVGVPCRTIQRAVDQAATGDEIRVAGGTYADLRRWTTAPVVAGNQYGVPSQVLSIQKAVTVRGGYATSDWATSDPVGRPTILDAGYAHTVVTLTGNFQVGETIAGGSSAATAVVTAMDGPRFKLTATSGSFSSGEVVTGATSGATGQIGNAYTIVPVSGVLQVGETVAGGTSGAQAVVADIVGNRIAFNVTSGVFKAAETLTGGTSGATATLADIRFTVSGRVVLVSGANGVAIEGLRLTGGNASRSGNSIPMHISSDTGTGGGLAVEDATVTLDRLTIDHNVASSTSGPPEHMGFGGGLYANRATVVMRHSRVEANNANPRWWGYGHGVAFFTCRVMLENNTIANNMGGGVEGWQGYGIAYGAAAYIWHSTGTLHANTISGNGQLESNRAGAADAVNVGGAGPLQVLGNRFQNNQGRALSWGGWLDLQKNVFTGNTGGAISTNGTGKLTNNVIVENGATDIEGSAIYISQNSGKTTVVARHNTIARNLGTDAVHSYRAAIEFWNTIFADNTTAVLVDDQFKQGSFKLYYSLFSGNGANTTGVVTEENSLAGAAGFAADGYHLTAASAAVDAGYPTRIVSDDIDGILRFRGRNTDIGAVESPFVSVAQTGGIGFEKLAAPVKWTKGNQSLQEYYLRFQNGADTTVTIPSYTVTDTWPPGLALTEFGNYPPLEHNVAASPYVFTSTAPLAPGEWGWIRFTGKSESLIPGEVIHNEATFNPAGAAPITRTTDTTVPLLPPRIATPESGEMCSGALEVTGRAQPGLVVRLYENGTQAGLATADADGVFRYRYTSTRIGVLDLTLLTARAVGAGGSLSAPSIEVVLTKPSIPFCAQRSHWNQALFRLPDGTPSMVGQLPLPMRRGVVTQQSVHLAACNCSETSKPPVEVWLEIDGQRVNGSGGPLAWDFSFAMDSSTRNALLFYKCEADDPPNQGPRGKQLIDPDGYIFDVTKGFDPANPTQHVLPGAKATLYEFAPEWGGWVVWPAELYRNQVNPQTVGANGYFAFFTPPGLYYIKVENVSGFQTWRSPIVRVVDEIVHVNVPLTPNGANGAPQITLTPDAMTPATLHLPVGGTAEWISSLSTGTPVAAILGYSENPVLQAAVTAKDGTPISALTSPLGFDSGMLEPGQVYRRQFTQAGTYTFSDGMGHTGTVVVEAAPAPTVTAIVPASGSTLGNTAVTIAGTGFMAGATVTIGGAAATAVSVVNAATITAMTPAHAAGAGSVVVTNPDAQAATLASAFTFVTPAQTVTLALTPSLLNFAGTNTGGTLAPLTPPQAVTVSFSGATSTTWTASASQSWVQIAGGSGAGSGTFTVSIINPANVLAGVTQATATVTVAASGATNSPQTVLISLTLRPTAAHAAPFGLVDTPLQQAAGVVGTIGVTGWVVDDVGVTGVKVYRTCLAFEPGSNCVTVAGRPVVFVGDATLVSGARPDVEALYPTYPQAYRAAWGYLLLTNLLPHVPQQQMFGGQGPLTLSALATDVEGRQTWLGRTLGDETSTTVTLTNDTIAVPFGAIDTPAQGATVSGTFANFGWALTPDANTLGGEAGDVVVPTNGSTLRVYLDGVPGATIVYNQCRGTTVAGPVPAGVWCNDDVASIFGHPTPQATFAARAANPTKHRNLDLGRGAIGALLIDTTTLANGVHTIMWGVTDSAGRGEGLGSRYFTVLNAGRDSGVDAATPRLAPVGRSFSSAASLDVATPGLKTRPTGDGDADVLPASLVDIRGRTGFDLAAPWVVVPADETGVRHVQLADLGRLELHLGPVDAGYLAANGEQRDLPVGSHLDAATSRFTWAPGVGYVGTYRLVFVRAGAPIEVDVTIRPVPVAAPGDAVIRMFVDAPLDGAVVSGPFTVAGWALDPQAAIGSGIDAVHVWAQRVDAAGSEPVFLGAAAVGGTRPDVATAFGPSFGTAGFSLTVGELAPGHYDITAYVRNGRTARWEDARTVSMTVR